MTFFELSFANLCLFFFEDILVYSANWDSHINHLTQVLQALEKHKLFAKYSKYQFGVSTVGYLGHIISSQGVAADPDKLKAIQDWPTPSSVSDLRGFLGLSGYYRRFVHHYAAIAGPLTDLFKK